MNKISFDELKAAATGERNDHPGRKGLFGRRSTREFGRHRHTRFLAREQAKTTNGKRV